MGQVIPWPKLESRPVRSGLEPGGPTGRVFLFLGVRYERHVDVDDTVSAVPSPDKLRRQRGPAGRKRS